MAALANAEMVDKVNQGIGREEFAALGWYFSKYQRLHREYKRLYPSGRLLFRVRAFTAFAVGCLVICAWSFGFFSA
jgi:hypothetical protein